MLCRKLAIITARVLVETSVLSARTAEALPRQAGSAATNPTSRDEPKHFSTSRRSTIASSGTLPVEKRRNSGTANTKRSTVPPEEVCVSGDQVLRTMGGGYLVVATLHTLSRAIPITAVIESLSLQLAGTERADRDVLSYHSLFAYEGRSQTASSISKPSPEVSVVQIGFIRLTITRSDRRYFRSTSSFTGCNASNLYTQG